MKKNHFIIYIYPSLFANYTGKKKRVRPQNIRCADLNCMTNMYTSVFVYYLHVV